MKVVILAGGFGTRLSEETEIKPKVLKTVNTLTKEYVKLIKYQKEKLDCVLKSQIFSPTKEKGYDKIVNDMFSFLINFFNRVFTSFKLSPLGNLGSNAFFQEFIISGYF